MGLEPPLSSLLLRGFPATVVQTDPPARWEAEPLRRPFRQLSSPAGPPRILLFILGTGTVLQPVAACGDGFDPKRRLSVSAMPAP